jgi:hypothetical protein
MVRVGDVIYARSFALRGGKFNTRGEFVELGSHILKVLEPRSSGDWEGDVNVNVTVLSVHRFGALSNVDYFTVLLPDGRVARIFDDQEHGYWTHSSTSQCERERISELWTTTSSNVAFRHKNI